MNHYLILFCFLMALGIPLNSRRIGWGSWQYWAVLVTATIMFEAGRYM